MRALIVRRLHQCAFQHTHRFRRPVRAKQRNGDFEGKVGLWFDQKTYRYRSRGDGPSWKRSYLAEDWNNDAQEAA